MPLPPLRPRFSHDLPCSIDEAVGRVRRALEAAGDRFTGAIVGHHADINLPPGHRRLWSPCLHLEFREEEGRPVLHGLLAPQPGAWTCYALTLLSTITIACFAACFAAVQWMMKWPPTGLAVMTGAILIAVILYRLSQMGQEATRPQMLELRDFAYEAIGIPTGETAAAGGAAVDRAEQPAAAEPPHDGHHGPIAAEAPNPGENP